MKKELEQARTVVYASYSAFHEKPPDDVWPYAVAAYPFHDNGVRWVHLDRFKYCNQLAKKLR